MEDVSLKPGVSVVVCCYNSAGVIGPAIQALASQEVPIGSGYEVILVDNNCTDDTLRHAKNAWGKTPYPLRIVKEAEQGLIHARKAGVFAARYHILLFVDDDNFLAPDWLARIHELFLKMPNVGIIGGYNVADTEGEKPEWFDRFQSMYACGPRADTVALNPKKNFGAGLAFRTSLLSSLLFSAPPFFLTGRTGTELTLGEDSEMVMRCQLQGWDFFYDPSLKLRHRIPQRRLQWNYLRALARAGGPAWVILQMYMNLIANQRPLRYWNLVGVVLKRWILFAGTHKWKSFAVRKQGAGRSIGFARLLGISYGVWRYRREYSKIRNQIINNFGGFSRQSTNAELAAKQ